MEDIKGLQMPWSASEVKLSLYADDSTAILTTETSIQKYLYWVKLFGKVSGAKVNYDKSKGLYLGKWKNRSDHPFASVGLNHIKYLDTYMQPILATMMFGRNFF